MSYIAAIGLEIHVQLNTQSKLFCDCPTDWSDEPNKHVCEVCLGHPGTLPQLNQQAVVLGLKTTQALGMTPVGQLRFARKHYIYPDLTKQYQTSMFYSTLAVDGQLEFSVRSKNLKVRFREAHLEEDAARLVHVADESKVDYNRAGQPLLEIVTEPDLHAGEEAEALVRLLQNILRTIGSSEANMELGQLRCDVNVSVAKRGAAYGTRTEVKNLNSPRFVRMAIEYETKRQIEIIEAGGLITQETRLWNENRGVTQSMRSKEMAHDYRYLPEPDIPMVKVSEDFANEVKATLPELPIARAARFCAEFGLRRSIAKDLVSDFEIADYFEKTLEQINNPQLVATWITNQVRTIIGGKSGTMADFPVLPKALAELLRLLDQERLSTTNAKKILDHMVETGEPAEIIMEREGLEQVSDQSKIAAWAEQVIEKQAEAVESFRQGKAAAFQFIAGKVMAQSAGRANPRVVREVLQEKLSLQKMAVINMGGAVCGFRDSDGAIAEGSVETFLALFEKLNTRHADLRFDPYPISNHLSENITVLDWFELWKTAYEIATSEAHQAVIVPHGLDTLPYTASLLRWLMPCADIPVVFTGALGKSSDIEKEQIQSLDEAALHAKTKLRSGVWVSFQGKLFPAVNFQMADVGDQVFRSRNLPDGSDAAVSIGTSEQPEPDRDKLSRAVNGSMLIKVYPGIESTLEQLAAHARQKYVILELFDTGTGNTRRDMAGSLLHFVRRVNESGGAVFCTSQLGIPVDMSGYATSLDLWNEGVTPLGSLISETAYTKLIATQILETERERIIKRMASEDFVL